MSIAHLFDRITFRVLGNRARIKLLKKMGVQIGHDVNYFSHYLPDAEEAGLLTIGNCTTISGNVVFVFHDGAIGPSINRNPAFMSENIHVYKRGSIRVGSHVFVGHSAIVLPNVEIGDYAVVAAGAVVTRNIPSFQIWGGVPAKHIRNVDDYIIDIFRENGVTMPPDEVRRRIGMHEAGSL